MIKWNATQDDMELIQKIAKRGFCRKLYADALALSMDIAATHLNGCPLKLKEWLKADDFNFFHDIYGIYNNLDRKTGRLKNCFLPRFAAPTKKSLAA
ncbi:MAG: hypothetical protein CVU71_01020 [Deltaproteobacteria bacterium HGW-Deltaproteobacteria-6]|jgi:hypothetical protein|nr:MAG: hypothetical protein CVU71_01020 [Deltaproteobacteria bacterium HGW-Deltaproteobacteria-6]